MVFERCCTARGLVRRTDWNSGDRNPQHLASRFGDEVGQGLLAAHQRHLAEGVAGLEVPDDLALTAVRNDGGRHLACEEHPEKTRVLAELDHGFVGFVGHHARPLHQLVQAIAGQVLNEAHFGPEKI